VGRGLLVAQRTFQRSDTTNSALASAAANIAAFRLEQLVDLESNRFGPRSRLTPQELVCDWPPRAAQLSEVAKALDIGAETVRSHLKKAQTKLGARNKTQTVADALRQKLIPEDCRWSGLVGLPTPRNAVGADASPHRRGVMLRLLDA
jgi:hypothetical protein